MGRRWPLPAVTPLSTQDPIAAALVKEGLSVYAWHGATDDEYFDHLNRTLDFGPHIIIDDGGDLVHLLHTTRADLAAGVMGGCEETTTGVLQAPCPGAGRYPGLPHDRGK